MRRPVPDHPNLGDETAGLLHQADIDEFKRLVREHCGVELDDLAAWNRATELVFLYRMMLRPIPEDPEAPGHPQPRVT